MLNHSFLHSTAHAQEGKGKHNAITSLQGSLVFGIRISEDKMGNTTCKGRRWQKSSLLFLLVLQNILACTTWAPNNAWHGWMMADIWDSHQIYTCVLSGMVPVENRLHQTPWQASSRQAGMSSAPLQGCTPPAAARTRWAQRSWAPAGALMPGELGEGHLSWVWLQEFQVVLAPQHGQALGAWRVSSLPQQGSVLPWGWRRCYRGSICHPNFVLRSPVKVRRCSFRIMP